MEDSAIIELYWQRDESAITETDIKYGPLCRQLAMNILKNHEDSEECVSDTYLGVWNSVPPERPSRFRAYLCRIARNMALTRYGYLHAQKRNSDASLPLEELEACIYGENSAETKLEADEIARILNDFLRASGYETRNIFLRRYWFCDSISEIAARFGISEGKVKSQLFRAREKLRERLEKEGVWL